jgi:RNAse (barnase) inhibitor barstar
MNVIKDIEALFANKVDPDVYLLSSDAQVSNLSSLSAIHRFNFFYIKGEGIKNKETFLKISGEALGFPDYYGKNWDAFEECIRDFGWCRAEGYLVLYDHFEAFARNAPGEFKIALAIFRSAIKYWKETNKISMYLLLKDDEDLL